MVPTGVAMAVPLVYSKLSPGCSSGCYQMVAEDGVKFDAEIPKFTLSMPRVLH